MSKLRPIDLDDRPDPVELRGDTDRPTRSELADEDFHVEPADFDDRRIAAKFGEQRGGFFAFENTNRHGLTDPF